MGILLGGTKSGSSGLLGLGSQKSLNPPAANLEDFPEGLRMVEIINGREAEKDAVVLLGTFAPHEALEFGGTQQIVKQFYAGSSEPSVQVLGPRENDVPLKGVFKTKWMGEELKAAAVEYQELVDAMRIRGNVLKITLGEWKRYGFLEECKFRMKRISEIEYDLKLNIIGFNPPSDCKFVDDGTDPIAPNKEVTNAALAALEAAKAYPDSMPQSLADQVTGLVSDVASVVATATGFIDDVVSDATALATSANRAIGLLKYARTYIYRTQRTIGQIALTFSNLGSQFSSQSEQTAAYVKNLKYLGTVRDNHLSLAALLAALQKKFENIAKTLPLYRHLVADGDTLQRISIKYYGTADNWKTIYDHNKLRSTSLEKGTVLEIPRI